MAPVNLGKSAGQQSSSAYGVANDIKNQDTYQTLDSRIPADTFTTT